MTPEEALTKAPNQIRKAELEAYDAKTRVDLARFKLKLREADIAQSIARMVGEDGKPVHKNESAREAALMVALERDSQANDLKRAIIEDEALGVRIRAHAAYMADVQRNARVIFLSRAPSNLVFDGESL